MFLSKIRNLQNSLLFRLTILYAAAFTALSTIVFIIIYYRIYAVTIANVDVELHAEVQKYAALAQKFGIEGIQAAIADEGKFEDADDGFYRLMDVKGNTHITTDLSSWRSIAGSNIASRMLGTGQKTNIQTLYVRDGDGRARTITAFIHKAMVIQIGESLEEVDNYMDIFFQLFALLALSLIGGSTLIGWVLARRATKDMQEVTHTAQEISKGDYHQRVKVDGRLQEIRHLGTTFNGMLDRIQCLLTSMKEINDNIAHDLRSPLARIRGIAEMNLLQDGTLDDYKAMAANTLEECDALIEMINTMLDITEAEAGVNGKHTEVFELVDLIKEACELFRPIAEKKKIDLSVNLPESLKINSDQKKLQRIVTNLIENAIKYTPRKNRVTVTASSQNGEVMIAVEDNGIGIMTNDLPHIFDRFYRCDRSRSNGGVGLGLSLVKAYTESVQGTIDVRSALDQGSSFTIRFPQALPQAIQ